MCAAASLQRMKIYFISRTVLYNLCYLLHHLSPREHCIQGLMMSARLYNIKRIIWSPSPKQWNEIYLTCYLSYVYALFPQIYLGICILVADYSKRRLCVCHNAVNTLLILSLSYSCLLSLVCPLFFSLLFIATFLHSLCCAFVCLFPFFFSVCRWTNLVKRLTTQMAPSPSSSVEMLWSEIH